MGKKYPAEVQEFIIANYKSVSSGELARMINERFRMDLTAEKVRAYKKNHRLRSGLPPGFRKNTWSPIYPEGLYEFMSNHCMGMSRKETAEAVNKHFGAGTMTEEQAAAYRKNHKLPCGNDTRFKKGQKPPNGLQKGEYFTGCEVSWFKKGNKPKNRAEIGTKRKRTDGYHIEKVQEQGTQWERWKLSHNIAWEQNFGSIPEGHIVGFKDGDISNLEPENLFLMTNEENLEMNRSGKRSNIPEFTETQLNIAKVRIAVRNRKRAKKTEEKENGKQSS